MAYVAIKRFRFGEGFVQRGETVPELPGRDYAKMVRRRLIVDAKDAVPGKTKAELQAMKRPELDEHASAVGVPEPEKLPNKDAVIDAVATAPKPDV